MEKEDILDLILLGRERSDLEFCGSISWNDPEARASLTRSILAMCHVPDGGTIVLGLEKEGDAFKPVGIRPEDKATFSESEVLSYVHDFADSTVRLRIKEVSAEGSQFLAIEVAEFQQVPIYCVKEGPAGLKRGVLYTRTDGNAPKSDEVHSTEQLKAILERAVAKAVHATRLRIYEANLSAARPGQAVKLPENNQFELPGQVIPMTGEHQQNFQKQLDDGVPLGAQRIKKIQSTGYWRFLIRPTRFDINRITDGAACRQILDKSVVLVRGSGYPPRNPKETNDGPGWIESGNDYMSYVHYWKFFQTGQFVHYLSLREDREIDIKNADQFNIPGPYPSGRYLDIFATLYLVTEVFQFASRLAYAGILKPSAEITLELHCADDRQLFCSDKLWGFNELFISQSPEAKVVRTHREDELINDAPALAVQACLALFTIFHGKSIPAHMLQIKQKEFLELEL